MQTTTVIAKMPEVMREAKIARVSSSLITRQYKSEQVICFAVLLVFLTFIHNSEEFSFFGFGGSGGGDNDLQNDIVEKMLSKKRATMKKFKFHKLERSQNDDDNNDDDENDDNDNNNNITNNNNNDDDNDNDNDQHDDDDDESDDDNDNDDEDDNNVVSVHSKGSDVNSKHHKFSYASKKSLHETAKYAKKDDDNDDDDEDNDDDDNDEDDDNEKYHFKKARTAHKTITRAKRKTNDGDGDGDDDDDDDDDADNEESYFSWLYNILGDWLGKDIDEKSDHDNEDNDDDQDNEVEPSNTIIQWLMWLRDKFPLAIKEDDNDDGDDHNNGESWLEYLNRWPFNSLFPIGKQGKLIKMPKIPKIKHTAVDADKDGDDDDDDNDDDDDDDDEEDDLLDFGVPLFTATLLEDMEDNKCRRQLEVFQEQLGEHKLWTLQMLDSTAKITTGLLRGNINQFGDFSMCINVRGSVKLESSDQQSVRIRGKYCLAHIEIHASEPKLRLPVYMLHGRGLIRGHLGNPNHFIPRFGVANVGVCMPHLCSAETVQKIVESKLKPYNSTGVEMHVEIEDNDCYIKQSKNILKIFQTDKKFSATLVYCIGLTLLLTTTAISENRFRLKCLFNKIIMYILNLIRKRKLIMEKEAIKESANEDNAWLNEQNMVKEKTSTAQEQTEIEALEKTCYATEQLSFGALAEQVFTSFSPINTYKTLIAYDVANSQFPYMSIFKLSATFFLYLSLKFLMLGHLPITNRDEMVYSFEKSWSILLRNPLIYSDALLLICGFMAGYKLSEEMEQKSQINVLKRVALKVSRYLPTIHLFICFQTWILPYLNAAPLWTNLIGQNARLCEEQWWRNMFSVQNAIDFEDTCSPATIQVALEIQLYLLGPLIVWLYYTNSDVAFFTYGALHAFSIAARYSYTKRDHLSMILFHGINVSKILRTANNLYMSPISRATPYLLGIGSGILQKTTDGILDVTPEIERLGWILALLGLWWSLWSPSNAMHTDYVYNATDAASYAAWCPLIFGLSLCWLLFMLPRNEQPYIQTVITSRLVLLLSHLIFPIQLAMFLMVLYNTAIVTESIKFHTTALINISEIVYIILGAIILAFLIDVPNKKVRHLLVNYIFNRRLAQEKSDVETDVGSGTEMSDASEEATTEQSAEPIESIWSNDPEEEEERFLMRRTSLLNYSNTNNVEEKDKRANDQPEDDEEDESETEE